MLGTSCYIVICIVFNLAEDEGEPAAPATVQFYGQFHQTLYQIGGLRSLLEQERSSGCEQGKAVIPVRVRGACTGAGTEAQRETQNSFLMVPLHSILLIRQTE